MTIKNLLDSKGYGCLEISPDQLMEDAVDKMMDNHVGSLAVVEEGKPVGIITERDVMYTVYHDHINIHSTTVGEVMSDKLITFDLHGAVNDAMALMFHNETGRRIRHLPILDGEKLVAMVSIGDILKRLLDEKDFENRIMKNYIQNWPEEEVEGESVQG